MDSINSYTRTFNGYALYLFHQLSFKDYVLAGHSVANMTRWESLKGDLDFWVLKDGDFTKIFNEFYHFYDEFKIYKSMIEMTDSSLKRPRVNLIYTNFKSGAEVIQDFDWDYCRCYWTPKSGIVFGLGCEECLKTKVIKYPAPNRMYKRVVKALTYGYKFLPSFWRKHLNLLKEGTDIQNVKLDDLVPKEFKYHEFQYNDKYDTQVIEKLITQIEKIKSKGLECNGFKEFITLRKDDADYKTYALSLCISSIILQNPVIHVNSGYSYSESRIIDVVIKRPFESSTLKFEIPIPSKSCKALVPDTLLTKQELKEEKKKEVKGEVKEEKPKAVRPQVSKSYVFKIKDDRTKQIVQLNESGTAYLEIDYLPEALELHIYRTFGKMWAISPEFKHEKYIQSDIPLEFRCFYEHLSSKYSRYDGVLVSWYRGDDRLGIPYLCDENKEEKISLMTLYSSTVVPNLIISSSTLLCKEENEENEETDGLKVLTFKPNLNYKTKALFQELNIKMTQGMIITMCGTIKTEFTYSVKSRKECIPHIGLLFS